MNPSIAQRFKEKEGEWNFNTVVAGKVVSSRDLEEFRRKSLAEESAKLEELKRQHEESRVVVSPEELSKILTEEYQPPKPETVQDPAVRSFAGLEDFNRWYLSNREAFPEKQRVALNNLLTIETLVEQGCSCKREARRGQAHAYYQGFFIANKDTDLIDGIKNVGGFTLVRFFSVGSETPFLEQ